MLRLYLILIFLGGYGHAEITIPHCSFTNLAVVTSHQSNVVRHFRSDLHGCRPMSCLQELQVLQTLREGRREVRRLQIASRIGSDIRGPSHLDGTQDFRDAGAPSAPQPVE
jgi:hypothetical protein